MSGSDLLAETLRSLVDMWRDAPVVLVVEGAGPTLDGLRQELRAVGATLVGVAVGGRGGAGRPLDLPSLDVDRGRPFSRSRFAGRLAGERVGAWLDEVDPRGRATVVGTTFLETAKLHGRPVHGHRRPEWARWEDKTRVDALLRGAGVATVAHWVGGLAHGPADAAAALDRSHGVVVSMDSTTAHRGDATGLEWVRSRREMEALQAGWSARTRDVRVAPFLHGVPYSCLGMVLERGTAAVDPIEIVTLRCPGRPRLVFYGSGTTWRPPQEQAAAIRRQVVLTGAGLARECGYRGMFSVDGVAGEGGCLPTEVNPRQASGLGLRAAGVGFPLGMLNRAVQERARPAVDLDPDALQEVVRSSVRRTPSVSLAVPLPPRAAAPRRRTGQDAAPPGLTSERVPGGLRLRLAHPPRTGLALGPLAAAAARRHGTDARSYDDPPPTVAPADWT